MNPSAVDTCPSRAVVQRQSGERGDQHRAAATPVARPARGIERDELGGGGDAECEPDARDAQADGAARPEQRDQRLEDRADDPEVDAFTTSTVMNGRFQGRRRIPPRRVSDSCRSGSWSVFQNMTAATRHAPA